MVIYHNRNHLHNFADYAFDTQSNKASSNICYYDASSVSYNTTYWNAMEGDHLLPSALGFHDSSHPLPVLPPQACWASSILGSNHHKGLSVIHSPLDLLSSRSTRRKRRMYTQGNLHENNDFLTVNMGYAIAPIHNTFNVCYYESYKAHSSIWQSSNPWSFSISFTSHLAIIIFLMRFIYIFSDFARQPRFVAEIFGGLVLGSAVLGQSFWFSLNFRPPEGTLVVESIVNLAIVFHVFLVGLEMDFAKLTGFNNKILCNTAAGILLPFVAGAGLHFLFESYTGYTEKSLGCVFWAIALSATSFLDIARILSDLKLLYTDIGRTALTSAFLSDLVSWALLVLTITICNAKSVLAVLPTIAFSLFSWFAMRPFLAWALQRTSTGGRYTDTQIYCILSGTLTFGLITDACGSYSLVGAYLFGLILPKGELVKRITDKLEDLLIGILLPGLFIIVGLRANFIYLFGVDMVLIIGVIVLASLPKIVSTLIVSMSYGIGFREGIALGVLMNTKGLTAVIILSIGRDVQLLGNKGFTIMVFALLWMMLLVKPISYWACKSTKRIKRYRHRTLERSKSKLQLRVLMCVHAHRNSSGMINLLQLSNPKRHSPISVFAANLIELTRRSTTMLIAHETPGTNGQTHVNNPVAEMVNQIMSALDKNGNRTQTLSFQAMSVVSPYETMHKDLCSIANDQRVSIILVPFHKEGDKDEFQQTENGPFRLVNHNLLIEAPCSVGIFIDRGLTSTIYNLESRRCGRSHLHVVVLFTGGPDSREALSYASKMVVGRRELSLTVVRFLPDKEAESQLGQGENNELLGDEYVNEFRFRTMCEKSINYVEFLANNGHEILSIVGAAFRDCDLYILGKGRGMIAPFASGLSEWNEYEELGLLGDALLNSDFANHASILVIQQHSK